MVSVREQGRRRAAPLLASAAVATMFLLSGCQGDAEPNAGETVTGQESPSSAPTAVATTAPATPEPSPASSAGPAVNIPLPVKPALADENSAEGLEAFTEYWFELFSYGYQTNDWVEFQAVTDAGCQTCVKYVQVVEGIYDNNQYISGGDFFLDEFNTDFIPNTEGSIRSFVTNRQEDITFYSSGGAEIRTDIAPDAVLDVTFSSYIDDQWVLLDYGKPEGT